MKPAMQLSNYGVVLDQIVGVLEASRRVSVAHGQCHNDGDILGDWPSDCGG